jgi:hypothetical protein
MIFATEEDIHPASRYRFYFCGERLCSCVPITPPPAIYMQFMDWLNKESLIENIIEEFFKWLQAIAIVIVLYVLLKNYS